MKILKFEQLDSTNNYAKTLIKEGKAKNGQIIYATSQTAGRGQKESSWESETGKNLTLSLITEPKNIEAKNQFLISQAVSVGIVNYLKSVCEQVGCADHAPTIHIKWPNDIYIGMKKIAGILIENTVRDNQILFSVIGVGLNVNQTEFSENAKNPTSLNLINKEQYDLENELDELTTCIVNVLDCLHFDEGEDCRIRYLEHLLFFNEEQKYIVRGEKIFGKIIGVNSFGFLQIQIKDGAILECDIKEVVYVF
ncbi:MAG: biotin--[acetyl-CoA-carboxylase] ligase [Bacteroidales bacterium]|nr:biotin--[acetyl-CoA-carboxylase] ligase [Bacteroidales bacterium]